MSSFEDQPTSLIESATVLGRNLTTPGQTINGAVNQLNVDLLVIGCEPSASTEAIEGSWGSVFLRRNSPPFSRIVRAGARSIIQREDQQSLATGPQFHGCSDEIIEQATRNATEGVVWIDPDEALFRERIATQNALLLKCMIGGLADGGYRPKASGRDIRDEFDEILDGLWTRGSYGSFPESRVVAAIMRQSGVRNPISTVHTLHRTFGFAREHGAGLAITRLLPDKLVAKL